VTADGPESRQAVGVAVRQGERSPDSFDAAYGDAGLVRSPSMRIRRARRNHARTNGRRRGRGRGHLHPPLAPREPLRIFGDGTQTRDLLFVTDAPVRVPTRSSRRPRTCAILNAGTGRDVSVNDLAAAVEPDPSRIVHVEHIHPQSEIAVLRCDARLARRLLGWQPEVTLTDGLARCEAGCPTASRSADRRVTGRSRPARRSSRSMAGDRRSTLLPYARQTIDDTDVAAVAEALGVTG